MNLDAVVDALLADARADADALRADADRDAEAALAAARREADRLLAGARADGEAEARTVAATELARSRRAGRETVLAARRQAYDRLRLEAGLAAAALRQSPSYPGLVENLGRLARLQLGAGAAVTVDGEVGGVVARAGSRSVDYRLPAIAERCLHELGPEVDALWR